MRDFSIVLADSARARSYIQQLCANNLLPREILLMPGEWVSPDDVASSEREHFDVRKPVQETIKEYNLRVVPCQTQDINAEDTVKKIRDSSGKFVVLAGGGGQILRREILSQGVPILHVHPGLVPQFKGSTTIYYSVLARGKVGASAFFINEQIDDGPVILKREFELPRGVNLDYVFDPEIRGLTHH
jgi:methionyl-tRNA formyltransferase